MEDDCDDRFSAEYSVKEQLQDIWYSILPDDDDYEIPTTTGQPPKEPV